MDKYFQIIPVKVSILQCAGDLGQAHIVAYLRAHDLKRNLVKPGSWPCILLAS